MSHPNERHGHCRRTGATREWRAYWAMKRRCLNPRNHSYPWYGARGIKICDRWMASFEHFLDDMGAHPGTGFSLDRIDPDGPYSPENCRWAPLRTQHTNKRNAVTVFIDGQERPLSDVCRERGVDYERTRSRIRDRGWSAERALSAPLWARGARHDGT